MGLINIGLVLIMAKQISHPIILRPANIMQLKMGHQRGPDIPCFLKIEKWIITKIRVSSGKTNV